MEILAVGATSVLGQAAIPMLVAEGHNVTGTTRSKDRFELIEHLGATPVVADAYDPASLDAAFEQSKPHLVLNLLTDLSGFDWAANSELRTIGTRNLVDAAQRAGVEKMISESVSWVVKPGRAPATEADPLDLDAPAPKGPMVQAIKVLEDATAELEQGVVLRFGLLYGPNTWYSRGGHFGQQAREGKLLATDTVSCFIHTSDAGRAIFQAIRWAPGVYNIVDDDPAPGYAWAPLFCKTVDASPPTQEHSPDPGRPISNAKARGAGWVPQLPTWRDGFLVL